MSRRAPLQKDLSAASWLLFPLFTGCAQIADVDDYSVSPRAATGPTRRDVARFLGGQACEACIAEQCPSEVDMCTADGECAESAACMAACSNPACVFTKCGGAVVPAAESKLSGLLGSNDSQSKPGLAV